MTCTHLLLMHASFILGALYYLTIDVLSLDVLSLFSHAWNNLLSTVELIQFACESWCQSSMHAVDST